MTDTVFYTMKLKANKTPEQVFEKLKKKIRPKGATAKWAADVKGGSFVIDFGDGESEAFCLSFVSKKADGFCKVAFPMGGELFENEKKSEWKTLIALLHYVKPLCSEISVSDDYDIADEYFKSLDYKFDIRELTAEETERLDRIFGLGYTDHESFLLKIFSEDTGRKYPENFDEAINPGTKLNQPPFPEIGALWETYIFETSLLKKKCLREIYKDDIYFENGVKIINGDPPAEIYTFCLGVGRLFSSYNFQDNTWGRGVNVNRVFYDKLLPAFGAADEYVRCGLAYRFMLSVFDYCKFTFVGKEAVERMTAGFERNLNKQDTRKLLYFFLPGKRLKQYSAELL